HHFTPERLADFSNVDGVIAIAHTSGCANRIGGADYVLLQRTLAGMARHVNVGAYLFVGLGCEMNQIGDFLANYQFDGAPYLTIQDEGGIKKTVSAGVSAVEKLLLEANRVSRGPAPISELMLALQCGGSDSWSGVTANPALGRVADEVVRQGGTVVLGETTEVYGAEHLLTRRASSPEVAEKLVERIHWWESHTAMFGASIDNNPAPGNKAGGLTTIYEKSLGAVAKAGSTPLEDVVAYAERIEARGFVHMDTPGYDPV